MIRGLGQRIGQSLRLRIALSMATLVAVVGGAIALVGSNLLEKSLIDAHGDVSEALATDLLAELESGQLPAGEAGLIEAVRGARDLLGAAIYVRAVHAPLWTRQVAIGDVPVVLTSLDEATSRRVVRTQAGDEALVLTLPSAGGDRAVRIVTSLAACDAIEDHAQLVLLALAAAFVAIGTLWGDRLVRQWLGPLAQLASAMRDVTNGRFCVRLGETQHDEIGALARRFNMMSRALERHCEEAEDHTAALEQRVHERTLELERANAALRTLDVAKDAFLSNVSHEMRTPLTSILASVEILRRDDCDEPETRREFLGIVDQESKHLLELVDDVLELVAAEARPLEIRRSPCPVGAMVDAAIQAVRARADERQVTFLRHGAIEVVAVCDRMRITQVLDCILDNAIKFSPRGGTVDLSVRSDDESVQLRIRDEGPGLDADEIERVFTKFVQVGEALTDKPKGFGLGLALARRIVEAHGGQIGYERESGFGATFVVSLPLAPRETRAAPAKSAEAAAPPVLMG